MSHMVTMREAAALLGISNTKIWRLVRDGVLTATINPLDRREKLIRREDIEQLQSSGHRPHRFVSDGIVAVPEAPPASQSEEYLRTHWHQQC
jgi:excisionase family DNA binding protein